MRNSRSQLILCSTLCYLLNSVCAVKGAGVPEETTNAGNSSTAASAGAEWIFPSGTSIPAFNSVDTLNAQWLSNYSRPNLKLWCKAQTVAKYVSRSNVNVAQAGSRAILLDVNQNVDILDCHLTLQDLDTPALTSDSATFTVKTAPNATPVTWAANSPTAPTTSVGPLDMSAPTSTSGTDPASSNLGSFTASATQPGSSLGSSNGKGISTAAGVGIGIGVAVLAVSLAMCGLLLYLRTKRRRKQMQQESEELPSSTATKKSREKSMPSIAMKSKTIRVVPGIHEVVGNTPVPQELDGSGITVVRTNLRGHEAAHAHTQYHNSRKGDGRKGHNGRSTESSISESADDSPKEVVMVGGFI